ncbi:SUMF1/EgtB/PvdO family nonheme iron enzyme [Salinibius halmophilus]|uniref:SUMF1/EgtB/PvdO family nonheme iron enzyme n=1 Tax=Salinibius halmophilus TaxID=1853216 RepID=UPI000E675660|nr:SUMF1/EgtB/PvdO family nonheme iron enzyme [Salinibius halmophilus]
MPDADTLTHSLAVRYQQVRQLTEMLCDPLEVEDYCASGENTQSVKWYLGHVCWVIEQTLLLPFIPQYQPYRQQFDQIFNFTPAKAVMQWSRPTLIDVLDYRQHVDEQVTGLLHSDYDEAFAQALELCLQYEQMQQENILVTIKSMFAANPLMPSYQAKPPKRQTDVKPISFCRYAQQIAPIGHSGKGVCFATELPRHEVLIGAFELADRPVCNQDVLDFIADGGYQNAALWTVSGWQWRTEHNVTKPNYWRQQNSWKEYTLNGWQSLNPAATTCHLSFFEAQAIARWFGARLPSEFEWEWASAELSVQGNFLDHGYMHPSPGLAGTGMRQMFGDVWQWTTSQAAMYPTAQDNSLLINQFLSSDLHSKQVLRGGSCFTGASLVRHSSRKFLTADERGYMTGLRLARSIA